MLYVQTCLVRGPNKVEKHQRCHFQLYQGCRLICRNQISPQIQHGCQPCPHVQCGCGCLSNVQTCLVWVPNSIGKHLKCNFQLYLGCPFYWWKQIWHQIQNGRQTCPPCQVFSHAFLGGTKHRRKRVKVSFPTNYGMAFLFMESDLTSDPIWLQPTMYNVQTCPVWVSISQSRKTVKVPFSTKFGMPIELVESGMTLESRWPPVHHV